MTYSGGVAFLNEHCWVFCCISVPFFLPPFLSESGSEFYDNGLRV
jgi:hypothetical protein